MAAGRTCELKLSESSREQMRLAVPAPLRSSGGMAFFGPACLVRPSIHAGAFPYRLVLFLNAASCLRRPATGDGNWSAVTEACAVRALLLRNGPARHGKPTCPVGPGRDPQAQTGLTGWPEQLRCEPQRFPTAGSAASPTATTCPPGPRSCRRQQAPAAPAAQPPASAARHSTTPPLAA